MACGCHNLGPVEVYRGRPILYGLGNFFWSDMQEPLAADLYHAKPARERLTAAFAHPEETPQGRVGLVSFASTFLPVSGALPYRDAAPGRPGVSALKVYTRWVVPPDVMRALASLPAADTPGSPAAE